MTGRSFQVLRINNLPEDRYIIAYLIMTITEPLASNGLHLDRIRVHRHRCIDAVSDVLVTDTAKYMRSVN